MTSQPTYPTARSPSTPDTGALVRLARFVLRHRKARDRPCGSSSSSPASPAHGRVGRPALTFDFALPGEPGYETAKQITHTYGNGGEQAPSIAVVTVPRGADRARRRGDCRGGVRRGAARSCRAFASSTSRSAHDSRFVTKDGRHDLRAALRPRAGELRLAGRVEGGDARARNGAAAGYAVSATGLQELSSGGASDGPGVLAETLFGALGALAVLAFVFASLLAFLPLLMAAVRDPDDAADRARR